MSARLAVSPWGAGLDQVASIRCLQLLDPAVGWLKPRRIESNAWELIRRADWFRPVEPGSVQWADIEQVHLVGVTQGRHIPDLLPLLGGVAGEIVTYGHEEPRLPAPSRHVHPRSFSLTAHFAAELARRKVSLSREDALLLAAAVWERTGGGLVSRTTDLDWQAMDWLFRRPLSLLKIGNLVRPGWREGQRGLLNDLLRHMEDLEIRDWPMTLALVRSSGHVQEVDPIMDALWSSIEPPVLVAGICDSGRTRVWARSQSGLAELKKSFRAWSPVEKGRWLTFRLPEGDPERVKERILFALEREYKPEPTAAEIMTSSPRCVDWNTPIAEANDMMLTFNIMGMPVLREGTFAGMISRRDVDRAIQMDLWDSPIGPHISAQVPGISPDTPLRVVQRLMVEYNQTRLAVVAEGLVVGLITSRELLRGRPDPVPLPRRFLPLVRTGEVPTPEQMETLLKRVFSIALVLHLRRIGEHAQERKQKVFLVGGCVRDLLLERQNLDMDVVVVGNAVEFARSLQEKFGGELVHFAQFHTARWVVEGLKIDFSSARIEHYAEVAALPKVELAGLTNDLYRRDFTMNALAIDLLPDRFLQVQDFFGGYRDLKARCIRILHQFSFMEDPTRLYRAIRFASRFSFELSEETRRAFDLAIERGVVSRLSYKRLGAEITRCFQEEKAYRALEMLFETGLLKFLHRDLSRASLLPTRFRLIPGIVRRFQVLGEKIDIEAVFWAGLLSPLSAEQAEELLLSMGQPGERREAAVAALRGWRTVPAQLARLAPHDDVGLYDVLMPYPLTSLVALTAFTLDKHAVRRVFEFLGRLRPIRPAISGKDLIAAGFPRGPLMGRVLRGVLRARIAGGIQTAAEQLAYARELLQRFSAETPEAPSAD